MNWNNLEVWGRGRGDLRVLWPWYAPFISVVELLFLADRNFHRSLRNSEIELCLSASNPTVQLELSQDFLLDQVTESTHFRGGVCSWSFPL